jgi:hypothetical protein
VRRSAIENQDDPPGHLQPGIVVVSRRGDTGPGEHKLARHCSAPRPAVRHPVPPGLETGRTRPEPRERAAGTQPDRRADDEALEETPALPPGAETGRGETVDDVARRPLRPDGAGRTALHLGRGEGEHVGGEDG